MGYKCQSTILVSLRVKLSDFFPVINFSYYTECINGRHPLCFKVQTSIKKYILIQRCTQNISSSGTIMPVAPRPLVASAAPVLFECFIATLPLVLENFYLTRAVKYLCLSLCLWAARTGIDKVLLSQYADKVGGLGTKSSSPHPDLDYNWDLIRCDSWETYCSYLRTQHFKIWLWREKNHTLTTCIACFNLYTPGQEDFLDCQAH